MNHEFDNGEILIPPLPGYIALDTESGLLCKIVSLQDNEAFVDWSFNGRVDFTNPVNPERLQTVFTPQAQRRFGGKKKTVSYQEVDNIPNAENWIMINQKSQAAKEKVTGGMRNVTFCANAIGLEQELILPNNTLQLPNRYYENYGWGAQIADRVIFFDTHIQSIDRIVWRFRHYPFEIDSPDFGEDIVQVPKGALFAELERQIVTFPQQ